MHLHELCTLVITVSCKCALFDHYDRRQLDRHAIQTAISLASDLEQFSLMLVLWKEGALALFLLSCQLPLPAALIALAINFDRWRFGLQLINRSHRASCTVNFLSQKILFAT